MAKFAWVSSLFMVFVTTLGFVLGSNIPDYIHICHRSDPKVADCIKNSVEALRPKLRNGIPEIGVPGIDPFQLNKVVIFDEASTPNFEAYLEKVVAKGAGDFQITKLKLDVEKKTYRVGVKIPHLEMEGFYKINAKVLASPFKSQGQFHANATNMNGQVLIQAEIGEGNHLRFQSVVFKLKFEDFSMEFENVVNSDPVLSQAVRQLLTENKQEVIRMATPYIEKKCSEIVLELSNQITSHLDYDEVFPL